MIKLSHNARKLVNLSRRAVLYGLKAFQKIDRNGVIDFPEFVKLMEDQKKPDEREADMMIAFRVFDADNKGYIESAELRYILLNMDKRIPREELHEMIVTAKLDEDKRVTYQEFLALLEPHGET